MKVVDGKREAFVSSVKTENFKYLGTSDGKQHIFSFSWVFSFIWKTQRQDY